MLCCPSSGKEAYRSWSNLLRTIDNCHSLLIPSASDGKEKWLHGEVRGFQAQMGIFLRVSLQELMYNWKHDVRKRPRDILGLWVIKVLVPPLFLCSEPTLLFKKIFFPVESWAWSCSINMHGEKVKKSREGLRSEIILPVVEWRIST